MTTEAVGTAASDPVTPTTATADGPPGARDDAAPQTSPPKRRRRWLAWAVVALIALLLAAWITGARLGSAYQPVAFGDMGAGLSGHIVYRHVDNFGPMQGQLFLPIQPSASGGVNVSLTNTGPLPVTIVAASLNPPWAQGPVDRQGEPLRDAGQATYWPEFGSNFTGPGTRLAGLVLRPDQFIVVHLPVTAAGCWMPTSGWSLVESFWVTTRFMGWTHQVQIWWTDPFNEDQGAIMAHEPLLASQGGVCPR